MEKLKRTKQAKLFNDKIELITLDSVIGSGYEEDVAKLAIEDKIAYIIHLYIASSANL